MSAIIDTREGRSGFKCLRVRIPLRQHRLFGFLLDSIEGLANHSRLADTDILLIRVSASQLRDFNAFLDLWKDYAGTIGSGS